MAHSLVLFHVVVFVEHKRAVWDWTLWLWGGRTPADPGKNPYVSLTAVYLIGIVENIHSVW